MGAVQSTQPPTEGRLLTTQLQVTATVWQGFLGHECLHFFNSDKMSRNECEIFLFLNNREHLCFIGYSM